MNNKKATKRALLTSVMALVMCVVMLVGTTFAWFTDTASTGVNKIQAGNLDVQLLMRGASGAYENIGDSQQVIFGDENSLVAQNDNQDTLWEPGKTQVAYLAVRNAGNLALKYNIILNVKDEGLIGALEYAIVPQGKLTGENQKFEGTVASWDAVNTSEGAESGKLAAGTFTAASKGCLDEIVNGKADETDYFALVVHMDKNAGNTYMNKSVSIDVKVVATQAAAESDSFNNQYDAGAAYPKTVADIKAEYGTDGLKMPAGVQIENSSENNVDKFVITLKDKESFLYFTQVFDRAAAFEARKAALEAGTATRYPHEYHNDFNMWYDAYCDRITVKMGCDVDLENITVEPFGFYYYKANGSKQYCVLNFDGNGHTIRNAKVGLASGQAGFFASYVNVTNVTLDNIQVSAIGCDSAGIVAGSPNSVISNVTVKNSSVTGGKYAGAIAGYDYGDITGCTVENVTVTGQYKVGGIVGFVCADKTTQERNITGNKLINVTVKGDNLVSGKNGYVIGKIVGHWHEANGNCTGNTFNGTAPDDTNNIGLITDGYTVKQ